MTIDYRQVLLDFLLTQMEANNFFETRSQIVGCLQANYPVSVSMGPFSDPETIRGELKRLGAVSLFIRQGYRFSHFISGGKFSTQITCTDHETGQNNSWSTSEEDGTCPYCQKFMPGIGPDGD